MEHHRLNSHPYIRNARSTVLIRCLAALIAGLSMVAGNAAASTLWVANADSKTLTEFPSKLKAKNARVISDSTDLDGASTIAFQGGKLWVTNFNANTIVALTPSQVRKRKTALTAAVIISEDTGSNLNGPEGLVFDSAGNMWVGAEHSGKILVYAPTQFATSGSPTPQVILDGKTITFSEPSHMAFDGSGNLWVIDEARANGNGGGGEIFKYSSAQILALTAGTNNVDPVFGIGLNAFNHLEALAFDGSGNMFLADEQGNNIYKFAASELNGIGLEQSPTPAAVLGASSLAGPCSMSLDGPYGVAFDGGGNLFVSNASTGGGCSGSVAVFSASSIGANGNPKPITFISSKLDSPNDLTFGPTF